MLGSEWYQFYVIILTRLGIELPNSRTRYLGPTDSATARGSRCNYLYVGGVLLFQLVFLQLHLLQLPVLQKWPSDSGNSRRCWDRHAQKSPSCTRPAHTRRHLLQTKVINNECPFQFIFLHLHPPTHRKMSHEINRLFVILHPSNIYGHQDGHRFVIVLIDGDVRVLP